MLAKHSDGVFDWHGAWHEGIVMYRYWNPVLGIEE